MNNFSIIQKTWLETFENTKIYNVTDRASLNGILERTDAYATGSGFIDKESVHGIRVIPLEDGNANTLILSGKRSSLIRSC